MIPGLGWTPAIGDHVQTWFSDTPNGMSRVLKVEPYRGRFPQWFTHVLTVTAPRTRAGHLEMAWDSRRERKP